MTKLLSFWTKPSKERAGRAPSSLERRLRPVGTTLAALFLLLAPSVPNLLAASTPALWKIESNRGSAYLLGSIHVAQPDLYPLDPRIEKAFDESDALVVEVDVSDGAATSAEMLREAAYPSGDKVTDHVSKRLFGKVSERLERHGLPSAELLRFKPWFLAVTLTALELKRLGIESEHGIDLHFLRRAKGRMPILELESVESQLSLFDDFSDKEQALFLEYTLRDLDNLGEHVGQMVAAWRRGDEERLGEFLREAVKEAPELAPVYRKLFDERNREMAVRLDDHLKTGRTYFVVVGAGHVLGETGLARALGRKYPAKRIVPSS